MKKLALLLGTVGSTAAWYILSNKKIRTELGKAKGPQETIDILKKYIGKDAEKIGKEVYELIHSEELQEKLTSAKGFAAEKFSEAKTGFGGLLARGKKLKEAAMEKMQSGKDA